MTHQDAHEILTLAMQLTIAAYEHKAAQVPADITEAFAHCNKVVYEQYQLLRDSKIPGK